jgi:hypothetical protein
MFGKIHDVFDVCMGKDLTDEIKSEEKKTKKPESSEDDKSVRKKDETLKSELSSEELIDLLDYINSEDLVKDFKDLFRSKKPSTNLKCLIDAANKILGINTSSSKKEYKIEYNFIDSNTNEKKNKQGEALLSSGISIDQLKDYNLHLEVIRVDKETGKRVSDGTDEDIKKIENLLREQFSKDVSKR